MADYKYAVHCPKLPWMFEFHAAPDTKILDSQLQAALAENVTNHNAFLNVQSQAPKRKLTGIICTLTSIKTHTCTMNLCEESCCEEILQLMMDAGMTTVCLKMSHFNHEECKNVLALIREATDNYSRKIGRIYPLAIAIDIPGPEIHIGSFKDPSIKEIELVEGKSISITSDPAYEEHVTEEMIYVDYQKVNEVVEPGDYVYIDNGEVQLSAQEIVGSEIKCTIEKSGTLVSNASVSLPGVVVDLPEISERDKKDISFAVENGVDAIFLTGIRNEDTLITVKEILGERGRNVMLITKIDNLCALNIIDKIIKRSDSILIDRAALGVEMATEKVFIAQKSIIAQCNKAAKPVICSAQILESMLTNKEPTKSEASDIANTILDGVDGFLLSKEISSGEYPVEAVVALSSICKEAEAAVYQKQVFADLTGNELMPLESIEAIAISAVEASIKCNAAAIVVLTTTGRSAKVLAKFRPRCPIIAITRYGRVARQLHLYRGIDPIHYIKPLKNDWLKDVEQRVQLGITWGKVSGFVRAGDVVVVITGSRAGSGFTNSMKVVHASDFDAISVEE